MNVRPFLREDTSSVLELWDEAGGWYRTSTPATRLDVAKRLRALTRPTLPFSPSGPLDAGWVANTDERMSGFFLGTIDRDVAYGAPISLAGPREAQVLSELVVEAGTWFFAHEVLSFLVDVPGIRPAFEAAFLARGRTLWRRRLLLAAAPKISSPRGVPSAIRTYRPFDQSRIRALFRDRYPQGRPRAIPVPFVPLPRVDWILGLGRRDPSRLWVWEEDGDILGVIGATNRRASHTGDLGPFLTSESLSPSDRVRMVECAGAWLRRGDVERVRASVPDRDWPEAVALETAGLREAATSDLVELASS